MINTFSKRNYLIDRQLLKQFVSAVCIYLFVSIYLYGPYLRNFSRIEFLFVVNSAAGSIGCFLLSRRWTKTFSASILAGSIYAFGPFSLAFSAYHPIAGIPAAILPWLFIPAAFIRPSKHSGVLSATLTTTLYAFPFVIILLFFYLLALPSIGPFFPMPPIRAHLGNFASIVFPLTGNAQDFPISFYHIPLFAILVTTITDFSTRKIPFIILSAAAIGLSFYKPIMEAPPIAWLLLPVIFCSMLAAVGAEKIINFKKSPKHLLIISIIFYAACGADILWGAKYTLERIFGFSF